MILQRVSDRRLARRYSHQTPWRPCYRTMRGPCFRCWFREVTGINEAALAKYLIEQRQTSVRLTPIRMWRNTEGRWERE